MSSQTAVNLALQQGADIRLGIMDGGGNDILICDTARYPSCNTLCSRAGSASQKVCTDIVAAALAKADELLGAAARAGVRDVVYFFYPHIPAQGGGGGGYDEILDYAAPRAAEFCGAARAKSGDQLTCHFVDLREPFAAAGGDRNLANFSGDGIHPSQAGQNVIAAEIWGVMQRECLGTSTGSACCESP